MCTHPFAKEAMPSIYSSASSWVSEVSPAARNTLDFARIPRASKLLICGLFQKGRVLAQDAIRSEWLPDFAPAYTSTLSRADAGS